MTVRHLLFNKKGSTMIEAALIYPMILAAMMAVIYILISMYSATSVKANLHTCLREEILTRTETGERIELEHSFMPSDKYSMAAFNRKITVMEEEKIMYSILSGSMSHTYKGNALLKGVDKFQEGNLYQIDEKDYIRKVDLIRL
ncbi:hypothetical protein [Clostridium aminobutyricum]|uniref:Uncharacterized protein n=1 Tax=Clostridium aminobutyricum TaxID=33953 RepID=A0A939IG62_CLOAM|nr:hypothetical protein [Clostridium aminobutyricum]MBN7772675.1 hypothetical protein [Clostridium aminobutyricum]